MFTSIETQEPPENDVVCLVRNDAVVAITTIRVWTDGWDVATRVDEPDEETQETFEANPPPNHQPTTNPSVVGRVGAVAFAVMMIILSVRTTL